MLRISFNPVFNFIGLMALAFYGLSCGDHPDAAMEVHANDIHEIIITNKPGDNYFPLSVRGRPVPLFISDEDDPGVVRAMTDLQKDINRVTRAEPRLHTDRLPRADNIIIAGTIGENPVIDGLISDGILDVSDVEGKWETFIIETIDNPMENIGRALIIGGSDKRGTIYGIYELSKQIGVSPWYYWADVPVPHRPDLFVKPERFTLGEPAIRYRGIFLNNENPALYGWVNQTFGGFNHNFYEKVFELILRLRGNYLWPAMWGKAFHDDDPMNAEKADLYGVVIGYTHHEPMMRAHVEWARYGEGRWDYQTNSGVLKEFWREGIERMEKYESSVTLGMRGDGDEPMSDEANIELLERIVSDQRQILKESAKQDLDEILQIWALYKEVQEYYEKGMRVPDDVMILLANDNWGNVRLLPEPGTAHERKGGWGMYYHFDYVGGPRNYKWINTIQISRIWEQMHLTYRHGVDRLWLVNVGDLKPMEFPISFFLDFAWNPDAMPVEKMADYPRKWAAQQFGNKFADEIGYLLTEYTRFNSRRKPELLTHETYSLIHFREAERIVSEYNNLAAKASEIYGKLPGQYKDAYYQLVLYPVKASANLNELYVTTAKNRMYGMQGRAATNDMADKVRAHFERNTELDDYYHHEMSDGKWVHMMSQTRIGYTYWQQPPKNVMPDVTIVSIHEPAEMGIAVEGMLTGLRIYQEQVETREIVLPQFDKFNKQSNYFEIFNRGRSPFNYSIETEAPWLRISESKGQIDKEKRIWVSVDWENVPDGKHRTPITVNPIPIESAGHYGPAGNPVIIYAEVFNPPAPDITDPGRFIESNGYISIEAPHYSRNIKSEDAHWKLIPYLGRTLASMTPFPVTAESRVPGLAETPRLEYDMHLFSTGLVKVHLYLSPTKNYTQTDGLRYAVSFNDETPKIVNMHEEMIDGFRMQVWERWVADNINIRHSTHIIDRPGDHTLKIWMVDPGVVVQKIVVETGEIGKTYLGPPESYRVEEVNRP